MQHKSLALFLLAWLIALAAPAHAQEPAANPALLATANGIRDAAHARDLRLARFDVVVTVHGAVAGTEVTARFANTSGETLEGDFTLALPPGAVVTGYALDIGDALVDGVLVDRPRAKAVYEERVRQRIDPGLAEVATDGVFRTRVFPISARGGRTIRLRFVSPVGPDGYRLPLRFDADQRWTILTERLGGLATRREGKGSFDSALTMAAAPRAATLASRHRTGETFVQLSGALPDAKARPVGTLRVYWDRSRSRRDDRHDAELALLRRVLALMKPARVDVVAFNSSGSLALEGAMPDSAIEWLRTVRYRGATSYAALRGGAAVDRCLMFTDGRVTIDRDVALAPTCRVDVVTTSRTADLPALNRLATQRGGRVYPLAEDGAEVAAAIAAAAPGVANVTDDAGRALAFTSLDAGPGRWAIVTRAPDGGGVRVTVAGTPHRFAVPTPVAFDGDGALVALDTLATLGGSDQRAAFLATSRRYGVASPSLSFLVLETPQDYLTADVAPPRSYPVPLLADYRRQLKATADERAETQRGRLAEVAARWDEQVAWWRQRHDPRARSKAGSPGRSDAAPPPPPPPPPPVMDMPAPPPSATPPPAVAAPSPAMQAEAAGGDVVVTASRVSSVPTAQTTTIEIAAWQPDRTYLKAFDAAPGAFDRRFEAEEKKAGDVPAFYLDTAEWLRRNGRARDAAEMVLSALELPTANEVTLGIVAGRLERYGQIDRAIELRERHLALDPTRPQPKRLLALALGRRAKLRPAGARADLERAVALLAEVALTPFDDAYDGIDVIALTEANALIPRLRAGGGQVALAPRFVTLLDTDVRVVIDWTTAATDIDLWVDEPGGERADFSRNRTVIGGHVSNDMTEGYGPEAYFVRRAPAGTYTVRANVYSADSIDPNGLSLLTARLIRDFGRPTEREEAVDVELGRDEEGEKLIGRLVVPRGRAAR